jgi:hypothetical protein
MFTREELRALMAAETERAVSIFMSTEAAGREVRQNSIRFKNLVDEAKEKLVASGLRQPAANELLAPALQLAGDELFWRNQSAGLAVFVAPGIFRRFEVPQELAEEVVVGRHFHLKPLLPMVSGDGIFFVVALSAARARLFEATKHRFAENTEIDLPDGVGEITAETEYENTRHMSPVARTRSGTPGGVQKTHNFGEDPEEQRKAQLIEYLRRAAAKLEEFLGGRGEPVVLAARSEIHGHFRTLAKQMNIVEPVLELNPDALAPEELHRRAWAVVEPLFQTSRNEALDRFRSLLGTGDGKAATKPEEIVKAARYGRVDTLFVAADDHLWGRFDEAADRIVAHGAAQAEDEDLLDYAAVQTYLQGGAVNVLPKQELPANGPIAAILRY